jgi:hypothetical protein
LTKTPSPSTYTAAGQVIDYTLVAKNDGNVTLTNVTISDPKLGTLSGTQPVTLAPGASLTCTGHYTIQAGDVLADGTGTVVNTATVNGSGPQGQPVSATATATVHQVPATAQITPTGTTCSDFEAGTAQTLSTVQYSLKGNKVSQTNPGVFFYYTEITTSSVGFTATVQETKTASTWKFLAPLNSQIVLYDANCNKVAGVTVSYNPATGTATISAPSAPAGTYVIGIKYDTTTVVGSPATSPSTVTYTFETAVNGTLLSSSEASIAFVKK